ncbi:MAG: hypothetical protein R3E53_13580 [Myxococcota bacterium]
MMDLMRETLARGEQVYVVYPLVEESEKLDLRSAIDSAEQIARAFPDHRVDSCTGGSTRPSARRRWIVSRRRGRRSWSRRP